MLDSVLAALVSLIQQRFRFIPMQHREYRRVGQQRLCHAAVQRSTNNPTREQVCHRCGIQTSVSQVGMGKFFGVLLV